MTKKKKKHKKTYLYIQHNISLYFIYIIKGHAKYTDMNK